MIPPKTLIAIKALETNSKEVEMHVFLYKELKINTINHKTIKP